MKVIVINKKTDEEQIFTCPAREAVVCAFEQERKNFNTWDYDFSKATVSASGKTATCGDWIATSI